MPVPTIQNGRTQFFPILYEGNGGAQRVGKFVPFTDNGTIANSVIFNDADNAYVSKTFGTPTNNKKWTFSAWVKLGVLGTNRALISSNINGAEYFDLFFTTGNVLKAQNRISSSNDLLSSTSRTFEDTSKFYHFLIVYDSDNSTSADRYIVYVDGDRLTVDDEAGTGVASAFNKSGVQHQVGISNTLGSSGVAGLGYQFDGYMAEVNFVDGSALTPDTFGLTDTSTGRWIPKALTGITYGNNGFRLQFASSSDLGDDSAGSNDFSVTNLIPSDQTTDSPTQNFMVKDKSRVIGTAPTMEEGNLKVVYSSGSGYPAIRAGKEIPQSGKWYWEVKCTHTGGHQGISNPGMGVIDLNIKDIPDFSTSKPFVQTKGGMGSMFYGGFVFTGLLTETSSGGDFTIGSNVLANNDYMLFAFDMDNGKAWWGYNDSSAGSSVVWFANDGGTDGNPSTGANPTVTFTPSNHRFVPTQGGYAPGSYPGTFEFNFGSKTYDFTAPTGYNGLSQNNFPETAKGVSGLVWMKNRDANDKHQLYDSSRGKQKVIDSNNSTIETTVADGLQKFLKGGQQIEDSDAINTSGESFISWNWVGNNATVVDNNEGSITSSVQVNSTAGFSIIRFTGTNSAATVGHGLSVAPDWVISKNLDDTAAWAVYHKDLTSYAKTLFLSTNGAETSSTTMWDSKATTADVINVSSNFATNGSSNRMVMYAWHSVDGFSKFGKYSANGHANGTFVYTGFKPAWLMVKKLSGSGNWVIMDSTRSPINPVATFFNADGDDEVDTAARQTDLLSNGFKFRGNNAATNSSGTYVYFAFAEHPFIGSQTLKGFSPVTAR